MQLWEAYHRVAVSGPTWSRLIFGITRWRIVAHEKPVNSHVVFVTNHGTTQEHLAIPGVYAYIGRQTCVLTSAVFAIDFEFVRFRLGWKWGFGVKAGLQ